MDEKIEITHRNGANDGLFGGSQNRTNLLFGFCSFHIPKGVPEAAPRLAAGDAYREKHAGIGSWLDAILILTWTSIGSSRNKFADRRLMRKRPTEVHLNIHYFALSHREQFGIPELLAIIHSALVGYKSLFVLHDDMLKIDCCHVDAVRPTALEISLPVNPVVQRTGEVEIFADERFNRGPVFVHVALETGVSDSGYFFVGMWHHVLPC
jgi:hypothetical protein